MAFEGEFRTGHSTVMAEILKALGLEGQSVKRLVLEFDPRKVVTAYVVLHAKGVGAVPEILARAEGIEFRQVDAVEVKPDATVEVKEQRCKWCGYVIGKSRWCPSREQGHEVDASLPPYTGPEADKYAAAAEEAAMRQSYRELTGRGRGHLGFIRHGGVDYAVLFAETVDHSADGGGCIGQLDGRVCGDPLPAALVGDDILADAYFNESGLPRFTVSVLDNRTVRSNGPYTLPKELQA